jgi:nitrogen fixation/metabolism regulation signal transduction histidine kinase
VTQALRYMLVVGGAVASIVLFLLASASDNSGLFDRYYSWLLGLNGAIALALLVLVVVALARLVSRYRSGKFGSRLMMRLVLMFAGIGIVPGLVIFLVSVQFVSHSIDSWFNVPIEKALESGVNLGQAALGESLSELGMAAQETVEALADHDNDTARTVLARLIREQGGLYSALVVGADGKLLASSGARGADIKAGLPSAEMLAQAARPGGFAAPEGGVERDVKDAAAAQAAARDAAQTAAQNALDDAHGYRLRVVLAIPDTFGRNSRFLQLLQAVPPALAVDAERLRTASNEYTERKYERVGLRKMYIGTLALTLLLAIFCAIGAAFLIAGKLAEPLLVLAEGTRAVAEGDLSPRPIVHTTDELGTLTQSFNTMTRQLFDARSAVERNRAALQTAKVHLESVLENMSAGVIVLDADFHVVNANEAIERILQVDVAGHGGKALGAIDGMAVFAAAITKAFSEQSAESAAGATRQRMHWQQQIEIPRRLGSADDHDITLLARGSRLPVGASSGFIVVFDDISDVISAQRSIAWGEVARRLAHEIKNPLTPIQLSAERLQMKLAGHLQAGDAELLAKSTLTIVNQVSAMKRMVDDFRDYARTPPAVLQVLDLNALVEEILRLYIGGDDSDIIHPVLAAALPRVMGDATQLRQVIHNLLQNAQDALADRAPGSNLPRPRIDVTTEAIHYRSADGGEGTAVRLAIVDNGPGFAPKILSRAFEPYVTSKVRGTGLGLPMVKKIIDEHGGRIDIQNNAGASGASVLILLLKLAPAAHFA